ncbi:hypothetical protein GPJ56_001581 [Histomonas meleagridis]|uniref:uncharacterized protein n=1 Tax=Histomonas meleagridis TaxID=135588 RepID=UPI00355A8C94|nr:hypothetical protein GPJ56_001581 [Histomonas meleagridis]KAH0807087.1 hypothetical protein GO595_000263 [Histomonas meleagridis]
MSGESKKTKQTLRWAVVKDYWLEISQKSTEDPLLIIHLGFAEIKPMPINENTGTCILIKMNSYSGGMEYKFTTNNHFDIIDFYDSLQKGKESWASLVKEGISFISYEASFKNKGGLRTKSIDCSASPGGVSFSTGKSPTDVTVFPYSKILYAKSIENNKAQCFEIGFNGSQKSEMQLQCHNCLEMKKILTIILFNLNNRTM